MKFINQLKKFILTTCALGSVVVSADLAFSAETQKNEIPVQKFDDWALRCVSDEACELSQPLMVNQNGKPVEVLNLAVSKAQDKTGFAQWAMVVLTPLDVQLSSDFGFGVGTFKPQLIRYRNCNHLGCFVVIPLDKKRLNDIQKSKNGAAFFRLLNGQAIKVSFSLKGFSAAFDALTAKMKAVKK